MKIGLEASRANRNFKTGTEWYAWHLLQNFKKIDKETNFLVYYNQDLAGELNDAPANFYLKKLSWPFRKFWTHFRLGFELLIRPVDKFFASNSVPLFTRGEITVTIHDLGFFKNPELYHPLERIYQKISHTLAAIKADKIITASEDSKKDIMKYFPDIKAEIRVIYHGKDDSVYYQYTEKEKNTFKDIHDLPEKYLLYIGRLEEKKNIKNLIKAYKKSKRKWPLILAGRPGNYGYEEIEKLANDPSIKDDIIFLGYVSQKNHPKLLSAASGFVFPTKFEGFGIPIIEAMACGVPIACSSLDVLQEVAEDSALYFNPDNVDDMADILNVLFENDVIRKDLIESGLERAKFFTWEKSARETLKFIKE